MIESQVVSATSYGSADPDEDSLWSADPKLSDGVLDLGSCSADQEPRKDVRGWQLEELERPAARERHREGSRLGGQTVVRPWSTDQGLTKDVLTRDIVGDALGVSGAT
jgi:hypothetical protein